MSRLGIYADKIEAIREQRGLTRSGFRLDGTDPAGADKVAMERAMYERADSHMWFRDALGGNAADAADTEEVRPDSY